MYDLINHCDILISGARIYNKVCSAIPLTVLKVRHLLIF